MDARLAGALVIEARGLQRQQNAIHAQRLDTRGIDVEIFRTPAHLFAGQGLLAVLGLRHAHRFQRQHCREHAAVVKHIADFLFLAGAFALVVQDFHQFFMHNRVVFVRVL